MSDKGKRGRVTGLALAVGALIFLGTYVAGYLLLSQHTKFGVSGGSTTINVHIREFSNPNIRAAYFPAGWVEAKVRREQVHFPAPDHVIEFHPEFLP